MLAIRMICFCSFLCWSVLIIIIVVDLHNLMLVCIMCLVCVSIQFDTGGLNRWSALYGGYCHTIALLLLSLYYYDSVTTTSLFRNDNCQA